MMMDYSATGMTGAMGFGMLAVVLIILAIGFGIGYAVGKKA